jgi:flavodoxin short chain
MATAIIYWSGTGNTEAMARAIESGVRAKGADAALFAVDEAPTDLLGGYEKLMFGCPSMGVEVLEETEFEPFFAGIENGLSGKKVALFGSYGWGGGEWMRDWETRTETVGAVLFEEGLIQMDAPDEDACISFGARFADF